MKYHTQKYGHDPDNDIYGDCFRTCLACLLDLERDAVPHFMQFTSDDPSQDELYAAIATADQWLLDNFNLHRLTILYPGELTPAEVMNAVSAMNTGIRYMFVGKSKTECNHVVICKDGEIEHDPSITKASVVGPADPDGYYWVEFLGPAL